MRLASTASRSVVHAPVLDRPAAILNSGCVILAWDLALDDTHIKWASKTSVARPYSRVREPVAGDRRRFTTCNSQAPPHHCTSYTD